MFCLHRGKLYNSNVITTFWIIMHDNNTSVVLSYCYWHCLFIWLIKCVSFTFKTQFTQHNFKPWFLHYRQENVWSIFTSHNVWSLERWASSGLLICLRTDRHHRAPHENHGRKHVEESVSQEFWRKLFWKYLMREETSCWSFRSGLLTHSSLMQSSSSPKVIYRWIFHFFAILCWGTFLWNYSTFFLDAVWHRLVNLCPSLQALTCCHLTLLGVKWFCACCWCTVSFITYVFVFRNHSGCMHLKVPRKTRKTA